MERSKSYAESLKNLALDQSYRAGLCKILLQTPKEGRESLLDQKRKDFQYGATRAEKIKEKNKITFDGSDVFVERARLYHGTGKEGVDQLRVADDCTLGKGVYLTSVFYDAYGYARKRPGDNRSVYECLIQNLRLLDLSSSDSIADFLKENINYLKVILSGAKKMPHYAKNNLSNAIIQIENDFSEYTPYDIFSRLSSMLTRKIITDGYDGTYGKELELGDYFADGDHDSFVIFDPEKVRIVNEYSGIYDSLDSPD